MDLRDQTFGIEIEMTGMTRYSACKVIADYLGTDVIEYGGNYDEYHAKDSQNRIWKCVYDSSIFAERVEDGVRSPVRSSGSEERNYKVELVSPICTYEDIDLVQDFVKALRCEGAIVNSSTGIHVHIGAKDFSPQQVRNLVNIVAAKEDLIYQALKVDARRESQYCKKTDEDFLKKLNKSKPTTKSDLQDLWYNGQDGSRTHYHGSRYRCLNLHSYFQKETVEFRAFNSELNPEKIKAYIQFCMSLTALAQNQKSASPIKSKPENEKYAFRCFLLRLGMIGEEFKSTRKHLLSHLEGNGAWKNPEQAQAQKERLRAKRDKEMTQQENQGQEEQAQEEQEQDDQTSEMESGFSMTM
ncbi:MAG: amidoligase family protein [Eubacteriales bacterium]